MEGHEASNKGPQTATPRPPTRVRRKAPTKGPPAKRSLNLRVDQESYERLAVHAMKRGTTISALVEQLAREHLREYYVARNAQSRGGANTNGHEAAHPESTD